MAQPTPPPQQNLFDVFDAHARQVVQHAREAVLAHKHPALAPEHLLLGVLAESESPAARVVADAGVDVAKLEAAVLELVPDGEAAPEGQQVPFTPQGQQVLQMTLGAAQSLYHGEIGTLHLLLALLQDPNGVPVQALGKLGHDRDTVGRPLMAKLRELPVDEQVKQRVQEQLAARQQGQGQAAPGGAGAMTPSAQRVLAAATERARQLGHGQVGTVHLLLALLEDTDRMANNVLVACGVRPDEARSELLRQLRVDPEPAGEAVEAAAGTGDAS